MQLTAKTKIILVIVIVISAYTFGRWSAPEKVRTETKIVEVEKKTDNKKTDVNDHKKVTIVEVDSPDGTKKKTTTITDDRNSQIDDTSTDDISKTADETKEITKSSSKLTISMLASTNLSAPAVPIYGLMIQKELVGPITVGIFGLQDKSAGMSIGLTF